MLHADRDHWPQTEPLLTTGAHPHLQALQAIQPVTPLLVISPPFASQHDPNAHIAESRPGLRDLPDPHAQRRGVSRL